MLIVDDTTHSKTQSYTENKPSIRYRRYIYMYMSVLSVINFLYTIRSFSEHAILIPAGGKIKVLNYL